MKKIIFCFSFGILWCQASSQVLIKESKEVPSNNFSKAIGGDDSGVYMQKLGTKGSGVQVIIEKYDPKTLELIFSKEMGAESMQKTLGSGGSVLKVQTYWENGKIYNFFEGFDKENDLSLLFLQTMTSDGTLSEVYNVSSSKKSTPVKEDGPTDPFWDNFKIMFSPDQQLFCVYPDDYYGRRLKTVSLYNTKSLDKLWEKNLADKDDGKKVWVWPSFLGNSGNFYYEIYYAKETKKNLTNKVAIGVVEKNSPTTKTVKLNIPDQKALFNISLKELNNKDLFITAVLADTIAVGKKRDYINPSTYVKEVETAGFTQKYESIIEFDKEVAGKLTKTAGYFEKNFGVPYIVEMDKCIYVTTEYQNYKETTYGYNISHKDFIISKLDAGGNMKWMKTVPQNVLEGGTGFGRSVYTAYEFINGTLRIIYLQDPEDDSKPLSTSSSAFKPLKSIRDPAKAVCVSIDPAGDITKKSFYDNKQNDVNFTCYGIQKVGTDKVIVYFESTRKNAEKFGLLKFD